MAETPANITSLTNPTEGLTGQLTYWARVIAYLKDLAGDINETAAGAQAAAELTASNALAGHDHDGEYSALGHEHVVGDITATGTASGTTFLRGDGAWATPSGSTGVSDHADLTGKDTADSHPISAITGLQTALDGKVNTGADATFATDTHSSAGTYVVAGNVIVTATADIGTFDMGSPAGGDFRGVWVVNGSSSSIDVNLSQFEASNAEAAFGVVSLDAGGVLQVIVTSHDWSTVKYARAVVWDPGTPIVGTYRGGYGVRTGTTSTINTSDMDVAPLSGDSLLFVIVGTRPADGTPTFTGPSGSTLVGEYVGANNNSPTVAVYKKTYADEASWTLGASGGVSSASYFVIACQGTGTFTVGTQSSPASSSTSTVLWNGVSVADADLAIAILATQDNTDMPADGAAPSGGTTGSYTQRVRVATGTRSGAIYTKTVTAAGTEDPTIGLVTVDFWRSLMVVFTP